MFVSECRLEINALKRTVCRIYKNSEKDCLKEVCEIDEGFDSTFGINESVEDDKFREMLHNVLFLVFIILFMH